MGIAYLIIGLVALWILKSITFNQRLIAKNQVQQAKLLKELIKTNKEFIDTIKANSL